MRFPGLCSLIGGLGLFGIAAAVAAVIAAGFDRWGFEPAEVAQLRAAPLTLALAAGVSAMLAFAMLSPGLHWLRRMPLLLRAPMLGIAVVLAAHLLFGFVWYLADAMLADPPVGPQLFPFGAGAAAFAFALIATSHTAPATFLLGILAALLFEWLRQSQLAQQVRAE